MEQLLNELIDVFRLKDWDIKLQLDRTLETSGRTYLVYNDYMATISINPDLNQEEQESALIHEVLHIVLRDTQQIPTDNIKNEEVSQIWTRCFERENEKLAKGVYKLLKK